MQLPTALFPSPGFPTIPRFRDRMEAGRQLAESLRPFPMKDPLVLAVPRGGVAVGAALALGLPAELDVVLACKIRHPEALEFAVGAVDEGGHIYLEGAAQDIPQYYLNHEISRCQAELKRRAFQFRAFRPRADLRGRTVIVTDDGIATGATLHAVFGALRSQGVAELILAVPVAPPDSLERLKNSADRIVCLQTEENFAGVSDHYDSFTQLDDAEVVALLAESQGIKGAIRRNHPASEESDVPGTD